MALPQTASDKSRATPSSLEDGGPVKGDVSLWQRGTSFLDLEVDPKACDPISIYACFLNGFTSAPSFSACFVWCGFQTGNLAQLGLALARTFASPPERTYGFQKYDQQAFVSLVAFLGGATIGRLGDRMGNRKRSWMLVSSCIQVLFAVAASLCAHFCGQSGVAIDRDHPSWSNALGMLALAFISASIGVQGIVGKRLATPMNTTVVLTTTWVELFNDPGLFTLGPVHSRDVRLFGVSAVFIGAFLSRALLQTRAGSAGTLGLLAGLRAFQVVWWMLVKPKKAAPPA